MTSAWTSSGVAAGRGFGAEAALPRPTLDVTDQQYMMAIYLFIKNYVSASPGGSSAIDNKIEPIDNKIEQAMDLVKSHLLLAVREEVDVLKANISKLVDKISVLERENEVLKTNASPEVLAQLEEAPPAGAGRALLQRLRLQVPASWLVDEPATSRMGSFTSAPK
ncbi:TSC22 domain family protein 1-like, partial [Pollicipes pollicipes]|uniref:TSC22 domain family protein 1-like n=1 Tax=Pollicipes pollicipes TaxID=41117 RepID=UPI0018858B39